MEFTENPVDDLYGRIEFRIDEGEDQAELIATERPGDEAVIRLNAEDLAELIASASRALAKISRINARR